jgi:hypothetical protein
VFAYGKHVVGDYSNGNLYVMEDDVYLDGTLPIVRQRTTPHLADSMRKLFFSKLQIDMEFGVGLDGSGQGSDPKAMMQYSNDGGKSWTGWRLASIGKLGAYATRCIWRMLGSAYQRTFRIRITDPVKVRIISSDIEVS